MITRKRLSDVSESEQVKALLKSIREEIKNDEPTVDKILSSNLSYEKKKELVLLFEVYESLPISEEKLGLRNRLIKELSISEKKLEVEREEERVSSISSFCTLDSLKQKVAELDADDKIKAILFFMIRSAKEMPEDTSMYSSIIEKLNWAVRLPYRKMKVLDVENPREFCKKVRSFLDSKLYGMENVKNQLVGILNDRIHHPHSHCNIALKGPPGTGKTEIASAFAEAVGLPFQRIALGGIQDMSSLRGAESHYVNSGPGLILRALCDSGVNNCVILFDELDKLSREVQNSLLDISDYSQNKEFRDTFINEFTHDISNIWFIYSMNDDSLIDPILRDRLNIVEIRPYSESELCSILKFYIFPKELGKINLCVENIILTDQLCRHIVELSGSRGGVRPLNKMVRSIISQINIKRTFENLDFPLDIQSMIGKIEYVETPFIEFHSRKSKRKSYI